MPSDRYFNLDPATFDITRDFDASRFAEDMIADAAIDDAQKELLRSVITKPAVASKLRNSVSLRSDAQRRMDEAKRITDEAERVREENFEWARQNKDALAEFAASKNGGGRNTTVTAPSGEALTRAEVAEMLKAELKGRDEMWGQKLNELDQSYTGLLVIQDELGREYNKHFHEPLPYKELQEYALKNSLPLKAAFPLFIAPKLDEARTKDIERIKTESYEKGRLDAMSSRDEPSAGEQGGDLSTVFQDALLGRRRTQEVKGSDGKTLEGEDAFVASWNKTHGFTTASK